MTISLGTFVKTEQPGRLTYAFLSAEGTPINLTGFDVVASVEAPDGTFDSVVGQVDNGPLGVVSVGWDSGKMTDQVGQWSLVIWAGEASSKYASAVIYYSVADDDAPLI